MTELDRLSELCERLGAPRAQARVMAAQLLKRADQIAAERTIPREAALSHLLDVLVKGRAGEVAPELPPRAGEPSRRDTPRAEPEA